MNRALRGRKVRLAQASVIRPEGPQLVLLKRVSGVLLVVVLHLVVACGDDGSVAGRRGAVAAALACAVVLGRGGGGRGGPVCAVVDVVAGGFVLALGVGLVLALGLARVDEDVGDAAGLAVAADGLVLVGCFGVFGDDVPGVDEAGDLRGRKGC